LVSRQLRDNSCAALSYYGPTPARHGRPVIVRMSQVTRSSYTNGCGVWYTMAVMDDSRNLTLLLGSDSWWTCLGGRINTNEVDDMNK
jgi:hypothetical protein